MQRSEGTQNSIVSFSSDDFWFKVVAMLQQNWAVIEGDGDRVKIVFFDDRNQIFDQLLYGNHHEAERALRKNGFGRYTDDPGSHDFIAKPDRPFVHSPAKLRPIYSSGEYWN